jgi:hypothetical protein
MIRRARATRTEVERKDERRAEQLRLVGRRVKGSSMVAQMTPMRRVVLLKRQRRLRGPMPWRPAD